MAKEVKIEIFRSATGDCLLIDAIRVAGVKPSGSGMVTQSWVVDKETVLNALK